MSHPDRLPRVIAFVSIFKNPPFPKGEAPPCHPRYSVHGKQGRKGAPPFVKGVGGILRSGSVTFLTKFAGQFIDLESKSNPLLSRFDFDSIT